jgi:hypothetical protein
VAYLSLHHAKPASGANADPFQPVFVRLATLAAPVEIVNGGMQLRIVQCETVVNHLQDKPSRRRRKSSASSDFSKPALRPDEIVDAVNKRIAGIEKALLDEHKICMGNDMIERPRWYTRDPNPDPEVDPQFRVDRACAPLATVVAWGRMELSASGSVWATGGGHGSKVGDNLRESTIVRTWITNLRPAIFARVSSSVTEKTFRAASNIRCGRLLEQPW